MLRIPAGTPAATLRVVYVEPVGDNEGKSPDVAALAVTFDKATGEIDVTSTEANPFPLTNPFKLGIYVNLFNLDAQPATQDPSFFSRISDLRLTATTTLLHLVGVSSRLSARELGDEVAIGSAQGNPIGVALFGSVARLSRDREPFLGDDEIAPGVTAFVALVPEAAAAGFAGVGMAAPFLSRRRRRPQG